MFDPLASAAMKKALEPQCPLVVSFSTAVLPRSLNVTVSGQELSLAPFVLRKARRLL